MTVPGLSLYLDFEDFQRLTPRPQVGDHLGSPFDDVTLWGHALRTIRANRVSA